MMRATVTPRETTVESLADSLIGQRFAMHYFLPYFMVFAENRSQDHSWKTKVAPASDMSSHFMTCRRTSEYYARASLTKGHL